MQIVIVAVSLTAVVSLSLCAILFQQNGYKNELYALSPRPAVVWGNVRPYPSLNMGDLPIPFNDYYPYDDRGVIPGSNNHLFGNEGRLPPPSMDDYSSPPWSPARSPKPRLYFKGRQQRISSLGFGTPDLPIPINDYDPYDSRGPIPGSNVYFYGPYQGRFPPTVVDDYPSPPWDYGSAPSYDDPNY